MKPRPIRNKVAGLVILALMACLAPAAAQPSVLYVDFGRVFGVQKSAAEPLAPPPAGTGTGGSRLPLPFVTIEAYEEATGKFLGQGRANRQGFFRVEYNRVQGDHKVKFKAFLNLAGGGRELVGESDPVLVDRQLFGFELEVPVTQSVRAGTAKFSTAGQFVFTEVGDVDMDSIYDQEKDAQTDWSGFTKLDPKDPGKGPDLAFGGTLELYGLFEATSSARYYRINYTGPASGSIQKPLLKKNFVLGVGSGVEVHRVLLGPQTVGGQSNLYRLDEFLVGKPIPNSSPARFFSGFWTELGLRASWDTQGLPDGLYTLSVEAFDEQGKKLSPPAPLNHYSTLNLFLVNTPPIAKIHSLHYLPPSFEVLGEDNDCGVVVLNKKTAAKEDDNLQVKITAQHPSGFLREYRLTAHHGHNTFDGVIAEDSHVLSFPLTGAPAGPSSQLFVTPPEKIVYKTCAYRFHLQVQPRITNGYHIIYTREDNWYAAIQVLAP